MQPLDDDDLILYVYGESPDAEAIRAREANDPALQARLAALRELLATVSRYQPAEPTADFEARLWSRLGPTLEAETTDPAPPTPTPIPIHDHASYRQGAQRRRQQVIQRTLALAAVLVLVVAAFLLGRLGRAPAGDEPITVASDRILLDAVSEHLSRSQMLFLALANADLVGSTRADDLDILRTRELAHADSLLSDNRLYRQAAARIDQPHLAAVLDDLERVLAEMANAPADSDASHYEALRQRIDDQDLLFKVRVLASTLEHLTQDRDAPQSGTARPSDPNARTAGTDI